MFPLLYLNSGFSFFSMLECFFDNLTNLIANIIEISITTNSSEANTIVAILKEFIFYSLGVFDFYDVSYTI